jgi:hypothetical protein
MKVYYRLSPNSTGVGKEKIKNATKQHCLQNAIDVFGIDNITVIGDNLNEELRIFIEQLDIRYVPVIFGNGSGTFRYSIDLAIKENTDDEIVYLLEDDFLHLPESRKLIEEVLDIMDVYVTLYDHPDKYIDANKGGNPQIYDGGEVTKLIMTKSSHWKITNSTVMSWACKVKQLKDDYDFHIKYSQGRVTDSYGLFTELRNNGIGVISSVPGRSTHCETKWLSPLVDWGNI